MGQKVFVAGVGMTKFEKPGSRDWDYPDMVREAGGAALQDAGVGYEAIEQVAASYVYGDSCSGQRGLAGVPVYNLNNNCASGSTALMLGRQLVAGGIADVVMAVGFEKMKSGSLSLGGEDRAAPCGRHVATARLGHERADVPVVLELF